MMRCMRLAAQKPTLPATPPQAARRQNPPADWCPDTTSLTGQFTSVLPAQQRTVTLSNPTAAAAVEEWAVVSPTAAVKCAAARKDSIVLAGQASPCQTMTRVVQGLPAGLPETERPSWVPEHPIPVLGMQYREHRTHSTNSCICRLNTTRWHVI